MIRSIQTAASLVIAGAFAVALAGCQTASTSSNAPVETWPSYQSQFSNRGGD